MLTTVKAGTFQYDPKHAKGSIHVGRPIYIDSEYRAHLWTSKLLGIESNGTLVQVTQDGLAIVDLNPGKYDEIQREHEAAVKSVPPPEEPEKPAFTLYLPDGRHLTNVYVVNADGDELSEIRDDQGNVYRMAVLVRDSD